MEYSISFFVVECVIGIILVILSIVFWKVPAFKARGIIPISVVIATILRDVGYVVYHFNDNEFNVNYTSMYFPFLTD